jgi:hypothetical protein
MITINQQRTKQLRRPQQNDDIIQTIPTDYVVLKNKAPCRNRDSLRYVGYSSKQNDCNSCQTMLFSDNNVNRMSREITKFLGLDLGNGRPIEVPNETILSVLSEIWDSWRQETGDIYSRYIVPNNNESMADQIVHQTITVIVNNVRNTLEMENINGKLSKWDTVLGTFNEQGLRSHAPLTANIDQTQAGRRFLISMRY